MKRAIESIDHTKARKLGFSGEDVLLEFFSDVDSEKSDNRYDMFRDIIVNGDDVEIKTQVPYRFFGSRKSPAFTISVADGYTIRSNQLNKCMNVTRLIFIKRPSNDDPVLRIYEAPPLGKRYFELVRNRKDDRIVAGIYIDSMTQLGVIEDEHVVKKFMEDRSWL